MKKNEFEIVVNITPSITFWQAIKLRIAGYKAAKADIERIARAANRKRIKKVGENEARTAGELPPEDEQPDIRADTLAC
jgi:hypothetical protein